MDNSRKKPAKNKKPATTGKEAPKTRKTAVKGGKADAKASPVPAEYDPVLLSRITKIVETYVEDPELLDDIASDTGAGFIQKLNIDSVDVVEIIVDAEEAFGIKIEDDEIKALESFDGLYRLIESKIAAAGTGAPQDIAKSRQEDDVPCRK